MPLTKYTASTAIIAALADLPNATNGLTAAQLKAKFDENPEALKTFINEVLTEEIDAALNAALPVPDGSLTDVKLSNGVGDIKARFTALEADYVSISQFGGVPDGVKVYNTALQAAIDSLPATGGKIYWPKGEYIINDLTLTTTKNLVFEGDGIGATVFKRTSNAKIIKFIGDGTNNITIRGIGFDGNLLSYIGISATLLKRFRMIDCEVSNCGVVSVAGGSERGSVDGVFCTRVEYGYFGRSVFNYNERDGILGYPFTHLTVEKCTFIGNGRFPSANQQEDTNTYGPATTKYLNNYVEDCKSGGFDTETHSTLTPCYGLIEGNQIINCGNDDVGYSWGIAMGVNAYGEIVDNYISGLGVDSTNVAYRSGIICTGNKGTVLIESNRIVNSGRHGIFVETAGNEVTVMNNTSQANGEEGIFIYNTPNCDISHNTVKNNQRNGIKLNLAGGSIVTGNIIRGNSQAGSALYSGINSELTFNLTVTSNHINGSLHQYGFNLDDIAYTSSLLFDNNYIITFVTRWASFSGIFGMGSVKYGRKEFFGTAAPGSGTWRAGDIIWNTAPAAAGTMGWVCVTAGTFGTWKTFGTITA